MLGCFAELCLKVHIATGKTTPGSWPASKRKLTRECGDRRIGEGVEK